MELPVCYILSVVNNRLAVILSIVQSIWINSLGFKLKRLNLKRIDLLANSMTNRYKVGRRS